MIWISVHKITIWFVKSGLISRGVMKISEMMSELGQGFLVEKLRKKGLIDFLFNKYICLLIVMSVIGPRTASMRTFYLLTSSPIVWLGLLNQASSSATKAFQ